MFVNQTTPVCGSHRTEPLNLEWHLAVDLRHLLSGGDSYIRKMGKFCQIPFPGKLRIDSVMIASPLGALSAWHSFVRHLPAFLRNDMPFNAISRAYEKEKKMRFNCDEDGE